MQHAYTEACTFGLSALDAFHASIYPRATVKPVQVGHWLMIDAPEQVANLLLAGA
jgi:hypothetical protein